MVRPHLRIGLYLICVLLCAPGVFAQPQNSTIPGEVTTPYPTLINLSIDWRIEGDDNLNGSVAVSYREAGSSTWREGMPLRRIPAGDSTGNTNPTFYWDNRHSGSIFDLRPGTEYEIRLRLTDPDGGDAERTVRARTRPVPRPMPGAPVKEANATNIDEVVASLEPGDILQLTPGYYRDWTLDRDGAPGKPIVIRGREEGGIASTFDSVSLRDRKHVILTNVTVEGSVDLTGAEDVAVRYCTVMARYGIIANQKPGAKNCYIADNTVTYHMPWVGDGMGAGSVHGGTANLGEGIQVTGPGNVIAYNRVKGFRDCISTMEDRRVHEQISIDIYNNDVQVGVDDCIEADFCMGNCRVMRNRLTNCFMGMSAQPSLGGPTYYIRNVLYNGIDAALKMSRRSLGNVFLHNTVLKVGDAYREPHRNGQHGRGYSRNNLLVGGKGGGRFGRYSSGSGRAMYIPEVDPANDYDYDGLGTYGTEFEGQFGETEFSSLEELRSRTTEEHAVRVEMSSFSHAEFPDPAVPERQPADLRLAPGSAAIDAGLRIPNINDNFTGDAPDLGAYEFGQEVPHYGPRPEGQDEETERLSK